MAGARVVGGGTCPCCGSRAASLGEASRLGADLGVLWLVERHGDLRPRRFCVACAPRGPVTDIVCAVCGDGPLVAGELTDPAHRERVWWWLRARGWRSRPWPMCPSCTGRRPDPGSVREHGQGRLW